MKLLTALACFFLALLHAQAQPISNIRVTLPRQLPANTGEWATMPQPLIISAQAKPVQGRIPPEVMESRVVVTIERGGAKICGAYTPANAPMSNFTSPVKTWTGAQATGLLGQDCSLPAGDYELCVVFWGTANASIPPKEISEKKCFPFTIAGADTYSPPVLIGPENNKKYRIEELKRPVTFRWTPIVPKPREPVTYRLRVWQLMQGQNANAAMRANQPIVNKDVENQNQAIVTNLLSGPCDPPFICDFVWNVQALDKNGKPMGNNNGTSETWSFAVTQYIIQLDSIKVQCTATPGVYSFSYTITNPNPGTAQLNAFVVTSSTPAGASVGAFAPPIGTSIAPNAQLTITGTVNAAPNLSNICIGAEIRDAVNSFWKASKDTCVPVRPCVCEACNEKNFTFNAPPPQITLNNNNLNYTQPISITSTKTVKSITADLVYFELVPDDDLCVPCNKEDVTYGHFANGTNTQSWLAPPIPNSLPITIVTPPLTPCCKAKYKWCIRYKVEFTDCTSCTVLVCYQKEKTGCDQLTFAQNPK